MNISSRVSSVYVLSEMLYIYSASTHQPIACLLLIRNVIYPVVEKSPSQMLSPSQMIFSTTYIATSVFYDHHRPTYYRFGH